MQLHANSGEVSSDSAASFHHAPGPEVDHFTDPTELYCFIHWERWPDAAKQVVRSPHEVRIWISSRNSNDGSLKWRYLPLHLACRKSPSPMTASSSSSSSQGGVGRTPETAVGAHEALIEALLSEYPKAATMRDHGGMLPIDHARNGGASEAVLRMLLAAQPGVESGTAGRETRDCDSYYGPGPPELSSSAVMDLPIATTVSSTSATTSPPSMSSSLSLPRASSRQAEAQVRHQSPAVAPQGKLFYGSTSPTNRLGINATVAVATDPNVKSHELVASQMVINRLEEELSKSRTEIESAKLDARNYRLRAEDAERRLDKVTGDAALRSERIDALTEANDALRSELDRRDGEVTSARQELARDRDAAERTEAHLRSEAETCRALSEALEEKLRSKFATETMLSTRVREVEASLEEAVSASEAAVASFQQQEESLRNENAALRESVATLTKNNSGLQEKVRDLTSATVGLMESLSTMCQEQERTVHAAERHEAEVRMAYETERIELLRCGARQRKLLEDVVKEQDAALEGSAVRIDEVCSRAAGQRREILEAIAEQRRGLDAFSCPSLDPRGGQPVRDDLDAYIDASNVPLPE